MAKKQLQLVFMGFALLLIAHNVLSADEHTAEAVNVTILSSNLANGATIGEWGLSALVEADNHCVFFDAGRYPDTVIHNARALNVDPSCVTDVVLSHFHFDHTTGLIRLVSTLREQNPHAIRRVHVANGFFQSRRIPSARGDEERNQMIAVKGTFEALGVEHLMTVHYTGIEPLIRLRVGLNLNRRTAVVGAMGSRFVYGEGIKPTVIAM